MLFVFCKQKTAYEVRISDWSSDVCSSDLFIVHSLQEVNDALAHGRVFFMEIVKDGVILYQSDDKELGKPKPKTPEMALQAAQEYFAEYMSDATAFFDGYRDAVARRSEEHTSELQSLMRISYAVFCLKKNNKD